MRRQRPALLALAAAGLFAYACASDTLVAPPAATPTAGSHKTVLPAAANVNLLWRTSPLQSPVSVSGEVGGKGNTLYLPEAGLTIYVPAKALKKGTITVTANPGPALSYEFEPHGLVFNVPITITQDLTKTNFSNGLLNPATFLGAYYLSTSQIDLLNGKATVNEIFNTTYDAAAKTLSFQISHFSGYLIATGLEQEE